MLSRPPASLAAETSAWPTSVSDRPVVSMRSICVSSTIEVSPSEHSRKTSPSRSATVWRSTSTTGSGPSARVMIDFCGCSDASSAVSLPWRSSSSTSEWSSVSRRSSPSRSRYARESPTCAMAASSAPTYTAVTVVPMPAWLASVRERSWMLSLASSMRAASSSCGGPPPSGSPRPSVSTAIREATSPACAPPMPSATANSGARA